MFTWPQDALVAPLAPRPGVTMIDNGRKKKKKWKESYSSGQQSNGSEFLSSLFSTSSIYPLFSSLKPSLLLAGVICSPSHFVRGWLCSLWWPTSHRGTASLPSAWQPEVGMPFPPELSPGWAERGTLICLLALSALIKTWFSRWILSHLFSMRRNDRATGTKSGILTLSGIGHT